MSALLCRRAVPQGVGVSCRGVSRIRGMNSSSALRRPADSTPLLSRCSHECPLRFRAAPILPSDRFPRVRVRTSTSTSSCRQTALAAPLRSHLVGGRGGELTVQTGTEIKIFLFFSFLLFCCCLSWIETSFPDRGDFFPLSLKV